MRSGSRPSRIQRWYVPNATYFITSVTQGRQGLFQDPDHIELLHASLHRAQELHPFSMRAFVFLPDHFHLMLYIPAGTSISKLMHSIKWGFAMSYREMHGITEPIRVWQHRFIEHVIRDESDYENHLGYIHYNPVKHGLVSDALSFPHSSLAKYVERGWYGERWVPEACGTEIAEGGFEP